MSTEKQMIRVYAASNIAVMANGKTDWNRPFCFLPHQAMNKAGLPGSGLSLSESPIPVPIDATHPNETAGLRDIHAVAMQSFKHGLSVVEASSKNGLLPAQAASGNRTAFVAPAASLGVKANCFSAHDEGDSWVAIGKVYENIAKRWRTEDELHERMKDPAPRPVGGGREDRTAKEGEG